MSNNFSNAKSIGKYYITYKNGKRLPLKRKISDGWIKELKFNNIRKLEKTRWRIVKYLDTKIMLEYRRALSNVALVEKAHYIPAKRGESVLYECENVPSDYPGCRSGVSLQFISRPKKILHPDIGKRWHTASKRHEYFRACLYLADGALVEAITNRVCRESQLPNSNGIECIIINKRKYYFNRTCSFNGFLEISQLVFPYYKSNGYHEIQI